MNLIKWIRNHLQEFKKANADLYEEEKQELTKRLDQLTSDMLNSKCAIHGFENCSNECIHFYEGSIFPIECAHFLSKKYLMIRPSCKLWRK